MHKLLKHKHLRLWSSNRDPHVVSGHDQVIACRSTSYSPIFQQLIVVLFFLGCTNVFAGLNLVSPGPLAKAHSSVEGITQCEKCHQIGKQVTAQKCLDCHTTLEVRIARKKGYHGLMTKDQMACSTCHPDHAGRDFKMIQWVPSKEKFDHLQTGFELKGKHASVKCDTCHDTRLIVAEDVQAEVKKNTEKTYLGLSPDCNTCHFDEHRGQTSIECQSCHTETNWKKTPGFSHAQTKYPLTGKHKTVKCVKCHTLEADTTTPKSTFPKPLKWSFEKFKGISFSSCESCHKDVHNGKFGEDCESCHVTRSWKEVGVKTQEDRGFHEKTSFPLKGAHARVACQSCHGPFPGVKAKFKGLAFAACKDCHHDGHQGQLKGDCDTCHSLDSFNVVTFSRASHDKSKYPLQGAHRTTACNRCHTTSAKPSPQNAPWKVDLRRKSRKILESQSKYKFMGSLVECETCHKDPHKAQFKTSQGIKVCRTCHLLEGFKKLLFNHDKDTRYKLTGKHIQTKCGQCHVPKKKGDVVVYKTAPMLCFECHDDVHAAQFAPGRGLATDCEKCHTTEDFKKKLLFDHNQKKFSTYPLLGKHFVVKCEKCHPTYQVAANVKVVRYKPLPIKCADCHEDQHKNAFEEFAP